MNFREWLLESTNSTAVVLTNAVHEKAVDLFGQDLTAYCFVCSVALAQSMENFSHKATVVKGHFIYKQPNKMPSLIPHAWVESNGTIYDSTAAQFPKMPKVIVCQVSALTKKSMYDLNDFEYNYINRELVPTSKYKSLLRQWAGKEHIKQLIISP